MANAFNATAHGVVNPGFVPEIYSAKLQIKLEGSLVLASALVANRDFEGDIRDAGDTVKIPMEILDPTITPYHLQTGLGTPQELTLKDTDLKITEADSFNFRVEDIAQVQNKVKGLVAKGQERAARKLAEAADVFVSGVITTAVATADSRGKKVTQIVRDPAAVGGAGKAYETIVAANLVLDTNDVPSQGRYIVVSPKIYSELLLDERFISADKYGAGSVITNGEVGRILGMTVYMTTVMYTREMVIGHQMAVTFANQIVKTESYRPEKYFSDAVKGLHVYGARVIRPEALVTVIPKP
ncbi:phage capsid protein [Nonomuraea sp. NPDC050556]|uniref:phage capsid protein n=1 Tax=Nonomuraea sp. NPDC050556 TaxID=3364369 RepID=UPI003797FD22